MPAVDVSEILSDPDFAEMLTINRREVTMGESGRPTTTMTTINPCPAGVVIPQNDLPLQRGSDQQNLPRLISVHTPFRLRSASVDGFGNQYKPDIVVWLGDNYVVNKVYPFSHFGAGFISADCSSMDSTDVANV